MKKCISIISLCFMLILSGCQAKYQRISFNRDALGEKLAEHINSDTEVINTLDEEFPSQLPIYQITEQEISENDLNQMLLDLNLPTEHSAWKQIELNENQVFCNLVRYTDHSRGFFDMSEEELEEAAWNVFNKIPFLEGEYEYGGITGMSRVNDSEGWHIRRTRVTFYRVLDGIRISGEDDCSFWFDGSGLVQISITLYDYEKKGTMSVVPQESAYERIKTPDAFSIGFDSGFAKTLEVEKAALYWVNQHSEGCTILQPLYNFVGTATLGDGRQAEFSSKVIAIPESYTYEKTD